MIISHSKITPWKIILWLYGACLCLLPVISVLTPNLYGVMPIIVAVISAVLLSFHDRAVLITIFRELRTPVSAIIAIIALLLLVGSAWALYPAEALEKGLRVIALVFSGMFMLRLPQRFSPQDKDRLLKIMFYAFTAALLLSALELSFNHPVYRLLSAKDFTVKILPSIVNHALVILCLLFWPLYLYLERNRKQRIGLATAVIFLLIAIVLGKSATALLAFGVATATFIGAKLFPRGVAFILTASIPALTLAAPLTIPPIFDAFAADLAILKGTSASERLDIWQAAIHYAMQRPLHGFGIEAARHITDFTFGGFYNRSTYVMHPHNYIVQIWIEFGFIGAALLSALCAAITWNLSKQEPSTENACALALFTGVFSVGLVGYGLWQSWLIGVVFMMTLSLSTARTSESP